MGPARRLWRERRFMVLALGLWLLAELAADGRTQADRLIWSAAGLVVLAAVAAWGRPIRFQVLSLLVALVPFRAVHEPLVAAIGAVLPDLPALAAGALQGAILLLLSRLVALLARAADPVRLRRPWFSEATARVPMPRADVWARLAPDTPALHWDPRVRRIERDGFFPGRFLVVVAEGRAVARTIAFREVERTDGIFLEARSEPNANFCHGLAPVVSLLLEEEEGATRITLALEFDRPSLVRLARYWIDAPLDRYLEDFVDALGARPAEPGAKAGAAGRLAA